MTQIIKFSYLITIILLLNSCGAAKMSKLLGEHQSTLSTTANAKMPTDQKLDVLGTSLVNVISQSLSYGRTKCSIQHVKKFGEQNDQSINKMVKEIGSWMEQKPITERVLLLASIAKKPYARELINLVPKFEKKVNRKIKTFMFASKVLKLISPKKLLDFSSVDFEANGLCDAEAAILELLEVAE